MQWRYCCGGCDEYVELLNLGKLGHGLMDRSECQGNGYVGMPQVTSGITGAAETLWCGM